MPTPIKEEPTIVTTENLDEYSQQITLLLMYCVQLLGGVVSLPECATLSEGTEGKGLSLIRNTDGTATLSIREGPDAKRPN